MLQMSGIFGRNRRGVHDGAALGGSGEAEPAGIEFPELESVGGGSDVPLLGETAAELAVRAWGIRRCGVCMEALLLPTGPDHI